MEKQFVVLGLGIFGSTLVKTLSQYGREVIAIDKNPENVQRVADFATKAVIGDVTDFQFLSDLGLDDMDVEYETLKNDYVGSSMFRSVSESGSRGTD